MSIICHHSLLVVFVVFLTICSQQTLASYNRMQIFDHNQPNPNKRCPGKNETFTVWRPCKHNGYIVNEDPENCSDRYVCYVGLDEICDPGDRCAYDATCTMCGICQKCESSEKCSEFRLCPNLRGFHLFKRTIKKRAYELDNESK